MFPLRLLLDVVLNKFFATLTEDIPSYDLLLNLLALLFFNSFFPFNGQLLHLFSYLNLHLGFGLFVLSPDTY
jgi:hypothetical protein